ncbi:MAG: M23 family metallopeptidase [Caldilineaceae bacterium]
MLATNGRWLTPVANPVLSSDEEDHLARRSVDAWDLSAPLGTPVYPMSDGKVLYAGCNNAGGYGCWAFIQHDDGYNSIYGHMINEGKDNILVDAGTRVTAWTQIGRVGWTGQTSFGPHVHWEITDNKTNLRVKVSKFFSPNSIRYCKFCSAPGSGLGGLGDVVWSQEPSSLQRFLTMPQGQLGILLLIIVILAIARPETTTQVARESGAFFLRLFWASSANVNRFRQSRFWFGANLLLAFTAPTLLCSTALAVQIWMIDEGMSYSDLWTFTRYGFLPTLSFGYSSDAQYSAVWGSPCQTVGTLGRVCDVNEIVALTASWKEDVQAYTGSTPIMVAIPRINGSFGYKQARQLINAMHMVGGLVIIDVEGDMDLAKEAIDELVDFGLDGIALDLEFMSHVTDDDIREIVRYLGDQRSKAGLSGRGILVVWDVYHNITVSTNGYTGFLKSLLNARNLSGNNVTVVPIFTGYGTVATKLAGVSTMQELFGVGARDSGLMAFDKRWPINRSCTNFGTATGYDCQRWITLFSDPKAKNIGWWVQQ